MRKILYTGICLIVFLIGFEADISAQTTRVEKNKVERDIYFLASDELEGRMTGETGNLVAARFIAEEFRKSGLATPEGVDDYFQIIDFDKRYPAKSGKITIGDSTLQHGKEILFMSGNEGGGTYSMVFADQGWAEDGDGDYEGLDVNGKWVVVLFGKPGSADPREGFFASLQKRTWAKERGAVGMIEIYKASFPWDMIKRFLGREQTTVSSMNENEEDLTGFPYILSDYAFTEEIADLKEGKEVQFTCENSGVKVEKLKSPNVIGWIEGTDQSIKDEYIVLTAHYDHIGMGTGEGDIIYNGARDNAVGTSALLAAARYFSKNPPKRSLLIIALTGEELGLLGSNYYVNNPVLPLNKAIFNLNIDGAGYNVTDRVNVIGHDRVGILDLLEEAASEAGLELYGDPAPEQNLFDRSDNVNFAKMGIPAPTWSLGMTSFDQEIMKYYHQVTDHAESLDFDYIQKFVNGYILAVEKIANSLNKPKWKAGDKYEEAGNKLYEGVR